MTPTVASTGSPSEMSTPIEVNVPYSKTSVWNTPLSSSHKYDVHSVEMVANLGQSNKGRIITAGEAYNYPIYFADGKTPRWDIPGRINDCTIASSDQNVLRTDMVLNVPIPNTSFRVLELTHEYWGPSENTVYHGQCLAFPMAP